MPAFQTEVVGQHMAIQLLTQLSTEGAATGTTGQAAEDGSGDTTERDAKRTSRQTNGHGGTYLAAGQRDTGTASGTSGRADRSTDLHGCPQRSDLGGTAERTLQGHDVDLRERDVMAVMCD